MAVIKSLDNNGLVLLWEQIKNRFVAKDGNKVLSTNDFTTALKSKLENLESYTLPTATNDTLGGVKIGTGVAINNGVISVDAIPTSAKGSANGVATLDANGLIPTSQIPGAYDDVIDGYYDSEHDKFYEDQAKTQEITGASGKIYVDITGSPIQYRYGGSTFVRITTNEVTSMTNQEIMAILNAE